MSEKVTVALVQAAPVFLDLAATVEKAETLLREAAARGARVVIFPETWLPGYPVWIDSAPKAALWGHGPAQAVYSRLAANAPTLDGPEVARLGNLAGELGCHVVMGLHERSRGSLYNTLLHLGADGQGRWAHRKLVPTYTERMIWGRGDGSGLVAPATQWGVVGGLICWEHWMPLARAAMHATGEWIHVAQWPTVHELHQLASRHYAFEGGCFVLASGGLLTRDQALEGYAGQGADEGLELLESLPEGELLRGGSSVIAPDSSYRVEPVFSREEILLAELDPDLCRRHRLTLDTDGHYSRPDVFTLQVDRRRRENVEEGGPFGETDAFC